jgi:4-hydroxythreonine-4-phosphate dehydrogenase
VIDCENIRRSDFEVGSFNRKTGQASYDYVDLAINLALRHSLDAMTTGPICKEALKLCGIDFPGHTEILASRTQASRSCMMQYSEEITCTFVTVHVGYWQVPALLSVQRISDVIDLTAEAIRKIRHREPKLVVCGLNPHAGEHGLFGNLEEEQFIVPAVELAKQRGLQVEGPLPPDTAFIPSKRQTTDAFICMYHDQGHIPVKALAFDAAVNTTLGLPIIRTSVDHGTAYDIAWKGCVNPGSMKSAIRLAAKLVGSSTGLRLT